MLRSFFAHFKLPGGIVRWGGAFSLVMLALVMAACGATSSNSTASFSNQQKAASNANDGSQPAATTSAGGTSSSTGSNGQPTLPNGTPTTAYLIRALAVSLVVNKPLDVERQMNQDVFTMDPLAQAAGEQINQQSDGTYTVALTFSVSAAKYDAVKAYLSTFSTSYPVFKGKLISENESVQNVTAQYVDLQSRLKNLRTEQQRLLQLLSQAQSLADTLTIQDKLTDVEGQIEQIEGQINQLTSQTSYSTVTVNLSSTTPPTPPPPTPPKSWSPGDIFSAAASTMVAILQVVLDILIWVAVFAPIWIPVLAGYYVWRRIKQRPAKTGTSGLSTP